MSDISSAAKCKKNGWVVGTILEGKEEGGGKARKIRITAIGDVNILARCVEHDGCSREGEWTLSLRKWVKVGYSARHPRQRKSRKNG